MLKENQELLVARTGKREKETKISPTKAVQVQVTESGFCCQMPGKRTTDSLFCG